MAMRIAIPKAGTGRILNTCRGRGPTIAVTIPAKNSQFPFPSNLLGILIVQPTMAGAAQVVKGCQHKGSTVESRSQKTP